ncbi:unnamed protein product, partial [Symbiodinium pilosum]
VRVAGFWAVTSSPASSMDLEESLQSAESCLLQSVDNLPSHASTADEDADASTCNVGGRMSEADFWRNADSIAEGYPEAHTGLPL